MFYVTSLDGSQVEPLVNIGSDFRMDQSTDGTLKVSSSFYPENCPGYKLLAKETTINVDDYELRVKQFSHKDNIKSVMAISTFFDHSKTQVYGIFSGNHTLRNHVQFALAPTGWTYSIDPAITNVTNYINKLGETNVVALLHKICKYHECEFVIMPNNHIHIGKRVGSDDDYQYRYGHNITDVVLTEDSNNVYTFIRGFGKDGLEVSYTSPNISVFGKLEPDPIRDDRFTDAAALINYIKNSITDEPKLAIESRIPELTNRSIGERVWVIHEELGIEMQTRILTQTKTLLGGKLVTSSVVFGNTLVKSALDILVNQQNQINENKVYVNDAKDEINETIVETVKEINFKFEETETKIIDQYQTITSEYSASITANAREIRTEMSQKETLLNNRMDAQYAQITNEYNSSITQTAQQIQSVVSHQQTIIDSQGTRISSAESSITQQANLISQKVSQTDYNGQIIASLIEQSPYHVTIAASKINFQGHVFGEGSTWSGNISTAKDISVGRTIYLSDGSSIDTTRGNVEVNSWGDLFFQGQANHFYGPTNFYDNVNFLYGLSADDVGGFTFAVSSAGLTVRQNGTFMGICKFT